MSGHSVGTAWAQRNDEAASQNPSGSSYRREDLYSLREPSVRGRSTPVSGPVIYRDPQLGRAHVVLGACPAKECGILNF